MRLLVRFDGEGGRELALAPPPGQEPTAFLRLSSLGAYMLAEVLSRPVSTEWEAVPVEMVGREG